MLSRFAGEAMVRSDSALADSTYYFRQMYGAVKDSNWAKAAEFGEHGSKKFPKDPDFPFVEGNALRHINQFPQAVVAFRKTLALNPTQPPPKDLRLLLAQTFIDAHQFDSVMTLAETAIPAGDDKATWGTLLAQPMNIAYKLADSTKSVDDWQKALDVAHHVDSLAASPASKFFIGIAAFQIAIDAVQKAGPPAKDCALAKKSQDMFLEAQLAMPQGGVFNPDAAKTILGYIGQYSPTADAQVKTFCKK